MLRPAEESFVDQWPLFLVRQITQRVRAIMSKRYKAKRRMRYYMERFPNEFPLMVDCGTGRFDDRCWCGVKNPYFAPVHHETCGGTGVLNCYCGGDQCVCHNHGEVECFGCADCEQDSDEYDDSEYDESWG